MLWNKKSTILDKFCLQSQVLSLIQKIFLSFQGIIVWCRNFLLKMETVENKEEPGESNCWRAQEQEEEMEKFLK